MAEVGLKIHGTGNGICSLTQKEGEGLTVSFDDGTVASQFLSWKAFRQLLAMKTANGKKPEPVIPAAIPVGETE